jgi:hypothetical protein
MAGDTVVTIIDNITASPDPRFTSRGAAAANSVGLRRRGHRCSRTFSRPSVHVGGRAGRARLPGYRPVNWTCGWAARSAFSRTGVVPGPAGPVAGLCTQPLDGPCA